MKKKNIITTAALFLSICLFAGAKIENVKAEGIIIENPDDIVQYQLGTMRMDAQQEQLDEILSGLETVTLADEENQKSLTREEDFLAILLIHEDGQKDIFHFFQENEKWYMQTGDGELYENADFITGIINVVDAILLIHEDGQKDIFHFFQENEKWYMQTGDGELYENADFITGIINVVDVEANGHSFADFSIQGVNALISQEQSRMLHEYAKQEGFYPTEEELIQETEKYISDFKKSPNYEEYVKICAASGYEFEDLIRSQNDWVLNAMIIFRLDNRLRMEYMEGKDTIDGVVYDDFGYYQKAFRNKYVYQKEELNEILKEAYTQQKK